MKRVLKYLFVFWLATSCTAFPLYSKWEKLPKQFSDPIACGYFFDKDNGLIGTGNYFSRGYTMMTIWWTSDGGANWQQSVTPPDGRGWVSSFFMRDKLTGYVSLFSNDYSLWKTIDGGKTWSDFSQGNIDQTTSVYVTNNEIIKTHWYGSPGGFSLDGGMNYKQIFSGGSDNTSNDVDFTDDLHGVVTMGPSGTSWYTSDGGFIWNRSSLPESWSVYAVKGTLDFFVLSEDDDKHPGHTLYWSQDGGKNWLPRNQTSFSSMLDSEGFTGHIAGIGNTIYVQTDTKTNIGFFRSDDLGLTWKNVGGPSNVRDTRFCVCGCRGENVFAFDDQGNIWKTLEGGDNTLTSIPDPGGDISIRSSDISASAGDTVNIPLYINSSSLPAAPDLTIADLKYTLNTGLLMPVIFIPSQTGITADAVTTTKTTATVTLHFVRGLIFNTNQEIGQLRCATYVTDTLQTDINASGIAFSTGCLNVLHDSNTVHFSLIGCGDPTLMKFTRGKIIDFSIHPNPAVNFISIENLASLGEAQFEIFDQLGKVVFSRQSLVFSKENSQAVLDVSSLANGMYYLRIDCNGFVRTKSLVINR